MVSVIIPTYNEQGNVSRLLTGLSTFDGIEIIVVDGGSTDNTVEQVMGFAGVSLLFSDKGRALQLNKGGFKAKGDILFFLHADSFLDEVHITNLIDAMGEDGVAAGSFRLNFDKKGFWLRVYSIFSRFNNIFFTYGDQGLFVKKDIFHKIGGYDRLPIMEDFEIQKRLRKEGRFVKLKTQITTSSRRFDRYGVVWQQLRNMFLVLLFLLGVSPHWLAKHYKY